MKRFLIMPAILLFCSALALLAQNVRYNFDKDVNFSSFKTYQWVILKDADRLDDISEKQLMASVDAQLASKSLVRVAGDPSDLYVGYQAAVAKEHNFTSFTDWGYGGGWYYGGWYGGGGFTTGQTETIYVGQVVIDLYDASNQSLIWRGVASKTLNPKAKPEKRQENLNKAMSKLFKKYPPVK